MENEVRKAQAGDVVQINGKDGMLVDGSEMVTATWGLLKEVGAFFDLLNETLRLSREEALQCPDYEEGHEHQAGFIINDGAGAEVLSKLLDAANKLGAIMNAHQEAAARACGKPLPVRPKPLPVPTVHSHGHG